MKVVFKKAVFDDLTSIANAIAQDNPMRALSFIDEIQDHALKIGNFPELYQIDPRFRSRQIRRCVYGNYLIFYRIARNRVEILQIVHGATHPRSWRA